MYTLSSKNEEDSQPESILQNNEPFVLVTVDVGFPKQMYCITQIAHHKIFRRCLCPIIYLLMSLCVFIVHVICFVSFRKWPFEFFGWIWFKSYFDADTWKFRVFTHTHTKSNQRFWFDLKKKRTLYYDCVFLDQLTRIDNVSETHWNIMKFELNAFG